MEARDNLFYRLKRLLRAGTLLHVAAHPDDEDIGLLTYVAFKHYGRPVYWAATRGESGQNRINQYQGDALGVYRTWESLAAREIDGGECLFGPFVDFGFSKNAEETFVDWGRENLVRELVCIIRMVQPQVVVVKWAGEREDGHGHHQAVGQAARDAFSLAGSPGAFPEQLRDGYAPWQPVRMYINAEKAMFPTGKTKSHLERDDVLRINTGEYSHLLGRTYHEQAWRALNRHQTQGIDALPVPGDFYGHYLLVRAVDGGRLSPGADIFDGCDTGLTGIIAGVKGIAPFVVDTLKEAEQQIADAVAKFRPDSPGSCALPLIDAKERLEDLKARVASEAIGLSVKRAITSALSRRIEDLEDVGARALGLRLESISTRRRVTPGENLWVTNRLWRLTGMRLDNVSFVQHLPAGWHTPKGEDSQITQELQDCHMMLQEVSVGPGSGLSCPHWLRTPRKGHVHEVPVGTGGQPLSPPIASVECEVRLNGHKLRLSAPTLHRQAFPGGFRESPLAVVPPISLHPEFDKIFLLFQTGEQKLCLIVTARCNDEERPAEGLLSLVGPEGWRIAPSSFNVSLPPVDGVAACEFEITLPPATPEGQYELMFHIECRGRDYAVVLSPVRMGAPGLPDAGDPATCISEELILTPSRVLVNGIRARFSENRRYAYIEGIKEELLSTLLSVGFHFDRLSDSDLAHADLNLYEVILVGPNAYLVRSAVRDNGHRFLEYMQNGGNLVVLYHGYGYERRGLTPHPIEYSNPHDRVTDQRAAVTVLRPEDPLFRYPNLIRPEDFDGWVHDRGLYFFARWDERYTPLLSCADAGEPQKAGGLMRCAYGKGTYFYAGYSFHRQIPAGVAGAFRLLFNMLSWDTQAAQNVQQ